jgi:class 3 adenylate cyclase
LTRRVIAVGGILVVVVVKKLTRVDLGGRDATDCRLAQKARMSEYAERFAENDIDMAVLDLTDQHLKDLGVSLGHRLKILRAIRDLSGASVAVTAPAAPVAMEPTRRDDAERRQPTVMFCDLVGSTALSARLDLEDLRSIITAYHRCCTELVERHGFVAKYVGDRVLAYFGYLQAHEHDAERAVGTELDLVEAVPKLDTPAGSPSRCASGSTGLVVVGDFVGDGAAPAAVGETPNAARLQAARTRRLTGCLFEYRDFGAVALKGFAEDVRA